MRKLTPILAVALSFAAAACGGIERAGGASGDGGTGARPETTAPSVETTSGDALDPAEATVGPKEETAMPATGIGGDPTQPPPERAPEGVRTFPATTNGNVSAPVDYERDPPTNGDHAPIWQNCGFYSEPIKNGYAVHSMDHGAVWISYRPDLAAGKVEKLRRFVREGYVLVGPYPGMPAPIVATAWRNQLRLRSADGPRLRRFVEQFRLSETAPRSGNGCTGGVGDPEP